MKLNPQTLFLLDGIGGLISAFFLGIVLVHWEAIFGMPQGVLYGLAGLAVLFAGYSLRCYFLSPKPIHLYLKGIALINFLYCLLSLSLVFYHAASLSIWGKLYFFLEILIILILVYWEFTSSNHYSDS